MQSHSTRPSIPIDTKGPTVKRMTFGKGMVFQSDTKHAGKIIEDTYISEDEDDFDSILCKLCSKELDSLTKSRITLKNCGHVFHKKCLKKYVSKQTELDNTPVQCPNSNCKSDRIAEVNDLDESNRYDVAPS